MDPSKVDPLISRRRLSQILVGTALLIKNENHGQGVYAMSRKQVGEVGHCFHHNLRGSSSTTKVPIDLDRKRRFYVVSSDYRRRSVHALPTADVVSLSCNRRRGRRGQKGDERG